MILSVASFVVCAAALILVTVIERRRDAESTVTGMFDRTTADRAVRIALVVVWWWLGWHFLGGQTTEAPLAIAG